MSGMHCRISIEILENGFEVEVPDLDAMKKKMAEAKKKGDSGLTPYMGDLTTKYIAKSAKEVLKLITGALQNLPEENYDEAFAEAGKAA